MFAPLILAFFIMTLVWPMQHWLHSRMPLLFALLITMLVTVAVMLGLAYLVFWGFSQVGRSVSPTQPAIRRSMTPS